MKIIDFEKYGNVMRFYLGQDICTDYHGDDWDDQPYEHNAGIVYPSYRIAFAEIAVPLIVQTHQASEDYHYHGNSPFCKNDFKTKLAPCLIITGILGKEYSELLGYKGKEKLLAIYFGDDYDTVKDSLIKDFNGKELVYQKYDQIL